MVIQLRVGLSNRVIWGGCGEGLYRKIRRIGGKGLKTPKIWLNGAEGHS